MSEYSSTLDNPHLEAASLLPFDEIKVDTDLLKGKRTAEADELICKICHTYFLGCAPKVTRCAHAFCGDCLESWIQVQPTFRSWAQVAKTAGQARLVPCPVCKHPLNDKTDIHLILSDSSESDCVRMASQLARLQLVCHNSADVSPDSGNCAWEGTYHEYQTHAQSCRRNKSKSLIEANTTAPPETHQTKATDGEMATIFIPFVTTPEFKDTISVTSGQKVHVEERSGSGWIYAKNLSTQMEGWIPEHCIKRFDAWFEDTMASLGKHVEKCAAVRDFDPSTEPVTMNHLSTYHLLPLKEGDVFTVCERSRNGWNLVITSDGTKQGWVPDNRCKVIREGSDHHHQHQNSAGHTEPSSTAHRGTFVVRRAFEGQEKKGELVLSPGDTISVRQAHDSGWTLGTVVSGGSRKEGWFPDWIIDRAVIDRVPVCANCSTNTTEKLATFVKTGSANKSQDMYGPICSEKCWEQWMAKKSASPKPAQPHHPRK